MSSWCSNLGWVVESDATTVPNTLLSLEEIKMWFGAGLYENPEMMHIIDFCLKSAYNNLKNYCNRDFILCRYKEIFKSQGTDTLMLKNYPLQEIEEITANNTKIDSPIYETGVNSNGIVYLNKIVRQGSMLTVLYKAGFEYKDIPADLKHANLLQASFFYKRFGSENYGFIGMKSISKMNENITKEDTSNCGLISEVKGLLKPYIRSEVPTNIAFQGVS